VQPEDVLTHIDGVALANDGTVPFKAGGGRIAFTYLMSQRYVDDTTTLKLLRNGAPLTKKVKLHVHQLLVPESSNHRKTGLGMRCSDLRLPSYYIVGGLVFCTLCEPYLRSEYGEDFDAKAPIKLLDQWQYGIKQSRDDQVVILSQVLAHPCAHPPSLAAPVSCFAPPRAHHPHRAPACLLRRAVVAHAPSSPPLATPVRALFAAPV